MDGSTLGQFFRGATAGMKSCPTRGGTGGGRSRSRAPWRSPCPPPLSPEPGGRRGREDNTTWQEEPRGEGGVGDRVAGGGLGGRT